MKFFKAVSLIAAVSLIFMMVPSSLHAQSDDGDEPLYTITFEDGRIPDELETDGAWGVTDEGTTKAFHVETDKRASLYFTDDFDLRNYVVEARLKVKTHQFLSNDCWRGAQFRH